MLEYAISYLPAGQHVDWIFFSLSPFLGSQLSKHIALQYFHSEADILKSNDSKFLPSFDTGLHGEAQSGAVSISNSQDNTFFGSLDLEATSL